MLGKLVVDGTPPESIPFDNPDTRNLVKKVSMKVQCQHVFFKPLLQKMTGAIGCEGMVQMQFIPLENRNYKFIRNNESG